MTVKTDRRDARGIAQLLRMGWYRAVHCKTAPAQEVRAMLTARKLLQAKQVDVELGIRGILRGFGLKVGPTPKGAFARRALELVGDHETLGVVIPAMLAARAALIGEVSKLHKALLRIARADAVARRLMSVPGVGALSALTFKTAIDDPHRIKRSRDVGPLFGLTPRRYQSGEIDITGGISKAGDMMVRTALYEAATVLFFRLKKQSALKDWAANVAKRRGVKRAIVGLARKLAVLLHRIWLDGTTYRPTAQA
jgi:transposase